MGEYLRQNPQRPVVVEGITDCTGSRDHNPRLSQARANSEHSVQVSMGITTHGSCRGHPVASNASTETRTLNHRVEVTLAHDSDPIAPRTTSQLSESPWSEPPQRGTRAGQTDSRRRYSAAISSEKATSQASCSELAGGRDACNSRTAICAADCAG